MGYNYNYGRKAGITEKTKKIVSKIKGVRHLHKPGFPAAKDSSPAPYNKTEVKSYRNVSSVIWNNKTLFAGVFIILAAIVVVGGNVTGYITYTEDLAAKLNQTQSELDAASSNYNECQNNLISCASERTSVEDELIVYKINLTTWVGKYDTLTISYNDLNNAYSGCMTDKDTWYGQSSAWKTNHDNVVTNYAKDKCCNATNVNTEVIFAYSTSSNSVVCGGTGYKINCTSGTSNYP